MSATRGKLIFLVTEDWYFWSHRLPMARAARDAGFDVAVATRVEAHGERIRAAGFTLHPLAWRREEIGPWTSLKSIVEIYRLYRRERPVIVHHVAMKPALLGGAAALFARVPGIVSMVAGAGSLETAARWDVRLAAGAARLVSSRLLLRRNCRVIVQNEDDRCAIAALAPGAAARIVMIRGSGIDLDRFRPLPEPPSPPIVAAYVGRMIADKGVALMIEAQQSVRRRGIDLRLVLAGTPDPGNPTSLDPKTLAAWGRLPGISFVGQIEDVREIWAQAHIAVFASVREGLPKTLLEAAAVGRAIAATDATGTRDIAVDGLNARIAPAGDAAALADCLADLASSTDTRRRLAEAGRRHVAAGFSDEAVAAAIEALYRALADAVAVKAEVPKP